MDEKLLKLFADMADRFEETANDIRSYIAEKKGVEQPQGGRQGSAPVFPDDLAKLVKITDEGSFWKVKPVKFLGSQNFAAIADIVVKQYGGDYISAGKESHFRVPK